MKFIYALLLVILCCAGLNAQSSKKAKSLPPLEFVGIWQNNDFPITLSLYLNADGTGEFDGESITYKIEGQKFILNSEGIITTYEYKLFDYKLTLSGGDLDLPVSFIKNNTKPSAPDVDEFDELGDNEVKKSSIIKGIIDKDLVGNWCYINIYNLGDTSINKNECINITADGLYAFYSEAFMNMNKKSQEKDKTGTNSKASDNLDNGEWRLDGKTLYVLSKSIGFKSFTLEKRQHPKNNSPMLIINGRAYILTSK
jgi:hypothetical protein